MTDTRPASDVRRWLPLGPLVVAVAAATLQAAALVFTYWLLDNQSFGNERYLRLAGASTPFVALLALVAVAFVAWSRTGGPAIGASRATLGIATTTAVVLSLLAFSGLVLDPFIGEGDVLHRISEALQRLVTLGLAGFTILLAATAPTRLGSRPAGSPPPSPPDGADPESRP